MPHQTNAHSAAIATGHPLAASAGLEVLRDGGNAVDAAVAAMLAMCVVVPGSVGLGGYGGSAVIYRAGSRRMGPRSSMPEVAAVDFDSCAPLGYREGAVTADPESSYYGARSVTVPAVVAGLDRILYEYGSRPWSNVSQPAIRLAEEGFEFDADHKRHTARCAPKFDHQSLENLFPAGKVPQVGDRWRQPDLARLLRRMADEGPRVFYDGEIAAQIVRFISARGGILSEEDFRTYRPKHVQPLQAVCGDLTMEGRPRSGQLQLFTPPPPSGGLTSLAIVETVEQAIRDESIEPWSGRYYHLFAEAAKLCWHERAQYLGDPDFAQIPVEQLLGAMVAELRSRIIRSRLKVGCGRLANDSPHTANVIAIDAQRNLISLTATQGWMYGSHLVVDELGLVLNHGMSRFDYLPGHPNAPEPGKRMQHNMAPMIALRDGTPAFAYGLPGGPKIVSVTAQLALDTIAFGATPAAAISRARLHTVGSEPLLVSRHTPADVVGALEKLEHRVQREEDMGGPVNVLAVDPQTGRIDIASGEGTGAVAGF